MTYEPTVWEKGDKISIARLNKLEEAVKEASDKTDEIQTLKETVETLQKEVAKSNKAKG